MRVLFVALGYEQLSITLLSSILRRLGHTVGLAFSRHLFDDRAFIQVPALAALFAEDDIDDQIARFRPDVICFSSLTTTHAWMLDIARRAKAATGAVTVFGGVHPSAVPDVVAAQDGVDYVIVSEGDVALPMLLRELRVRRADRPMPNVVFQASDGTVVRGPVMPFFPDLDALPFFEKDLWAEFIPVDLPYITMSSRGCPYRCTFCFNNFFAKLPGPRAKAGQYVRQRSVEHFIGELKEAKCLYNMKYVEIVDDIFTLDTGWIQEFSRQYRREIGLPFFCLTHPRFIDQPRITALREAGWDWTQMGVQSADDSYKKKVRRVDTDDDVDRALDLLEAAGVKVKTDHIFGLVGESAEAQEMARVLYSRHKLGRIGTFWLTFLPGTEIINQGLNAGVITQKEVDELNTGSTQFFRRAENVANPELRQIYLAYEFLFRLMPLFPKGALKDIDIRQISALPPRFLQTAGFLADVSGAVKTRSWELHRVAAYYGLGMLNHCLEKLGRPKIRRFTGSGGKPIGDPVWLSKFEPLASQLLEAAGGEVPGLTQQETQTEPEKQVA